MASPSSEQSLNKYPAVFEGPGAEMAQADS